MDDSYYDDQRLDDEPGNIVLDFLSSLASDLYENSWIITLILAFGLLAIIAYSIVMWFFIFLILSCKHGCCTEYSAYLALGIVMGTWYTLTWIPRWFIDFPDNWQKWRNISSREDINGDENRQVIVQNPQVTFMKFHRELE